MSEPALRLDPLPSPDEAPYPSTLGDEDLVAELLAPLGTPDPDRPAAVLRSCGGLAGLSTAEPLGLIHEGVDPEEATLLLAASELGRRLARQEVPRFRPLDDLAAVATYLALRYFRRDQEVLGALYLDRRHRLLRDEEVFRGTLSRAAVEPRPILREAFSRRAASLVLFHTHPSVAIHPRASRTSSSRDAWPKPRSASASGSWTTSSSAASAAGCH